MIELSNKDIFKDIKFSPPSHKGRVARLEALEKYIREKGPFKKDHLYRFGLTDPNFQISIRVMDEYLRQLGYLDLITYDVATDTIKWKKQKPVVEK